MTWSNQEWWPNLLRLDVLDDNDVHINSQSIISPGIHGITGPNMEAN